jgi:ATP-dependent DNA helicase RecG
MALEVVDVDQVTQALLLATEESHTADLKAIEVSPGRLTRSLSAFANAEGGELFIGIDEDNQTATRTWRGFADVEDANRHIQALEASFPVGQFADYQFLRPEKGFGYRVGAQSLGTEGARRSSVFGRHCLCPSWSAKPGVRRLILITA